MESIQKIIKASKRDKQIDHPKTMLTLDSEKQKQTLRKTWKTRTKWLSQAWRRLQTKTPELQNSNKTKTPKCKRNEVYKNYSRNQQKER